MDNTQQTPQEALQSARSHPNSLEALNALRALAAQGWWSVSPAGITTRIVYDEQGETKATPTVPVAYGALDEQGNPLPYTEATLEYISRLHNVFPSVAYRLEQAAARVKELEVQTETPKPLPANVTKWLAMVDSKPSVGFDGNLRYPLEYPRREHLVDALREAATWVAESIQQTNQVLVTLPLAATPTVLGGTEYTAFIERMLVAVAKAYNACNETYHDGHTRTCASNNPNRRDLTEAEMSEYMRFPLIQSFRNIHAIAKLAQIEQVTTAAIQQALEELLPAAALARPTTGTAEALNEESLIDLINEHLAGSYWCNRVWEAWQVGTMAEDDFSPVSESDIPAELAAAIIRKLSAALARPTTGAVITKEDVQALSLCVNFAYGNRATLNPTPPHQRALDALGRLKTALATPAPVTSGGEEAKLRPMFTPLAEKVASLEPAFWTSPDLAQISEVIGYVYARNREVGKLMRQLYNDFVHGKYCYEYNALTGHPLAAPTQKGGPQLPACPTGCQNACGQPACTACPFPEGGVNNG